VISRVFNTITIRQAEPEDAATIAYFSRKTFSESFAEQNSKGDIEKFLEDQFSVQSLMSEVSRKHNTIFLAYRFHTLIGYALMREANNPVERNSAVKCLELVRLYVDGPFKGAGVGSALIKECISQARLQNKEVLWLGVCCENTRAIDFYTKWGFQKCGSRNSLMGGDPQINWIMKKELQF
jgi:diamine N-acetyltransferase